MQGIRGIDSISAFGGGAPPSLDSLIQDVIAGIKKALNNINNPQMNLYQYLNLTLIPIAMGAYRNISTDYWLNNNYPGIYDQLHHVSLNWTKLSNEE